MAEIAEWTIFQWACIALLVLILLRAHTGLWYISQLLRLVAKRLNELE